MSTDAVKKIIDPFLTHGICKDEAEALKMLAKDYVERQVGKYQQRVAHFRTFYQTSVEQFAKQVAALCQGIETITALGHLNQQQQILQAEDDLEEWQAAEQFLARWQGVEAELPNASAA
jgi:predicted RNA-binding protein